MFINKTRNILDLNGFNDAAKSLNSKIQIVLKFGEDDLRFTLTEALTALEDIALNDLVSNFQDTDPEDKTPLIYDYAKAEAKSKHFHNIDYKKELTVRLQKKSVIVQGEMRSVTWYRQMEYQTINGIPTRVYSTPVLKTETSWTRDASGFAIAKNPPVRTWYNRDGSENTEVKVMADPYYYEDFEQIDEGVKRRSLLVKAMQKPVMSLIAEVMLPTGMSIETVLLRGRKFLDDYENEFNKFKDNSSSITETHIEDSEGVLIPNPDFNKKTIVVKLENEADNLHKEWLDKKPNSVGGIKTIRDHLIEEFSI